MSISTPFQSFFGLLRYGILSQILYFLTIPIILKKYDSSDYGIFTIAFSISSVVGTLSALRLERAIVVEGIDKIKALLIRCSIYIVISSLLCMVILYFALEPFQLSYQEGSLLVTFGGFYCLLFGFQQVFTHLAIRQEKLMITGMADITYSFLLVVLLLVLPEDIYQQSVTLIIIFTASRLVSLLLYAKLEILPLLQSKITSALSFKELRKYHIPVLTVLLSNIQFKGLFYLTGLHYGGTVTGQLSMSQRVVYAPVNLIGATLRKSFFLEFTKQEKNNQTINSYVHKILNFGSLISLLIFPFFIVLMNMLKPYIPEGWGASIPFAIALYPVASILVLLSWLDRIYDAKKKQATALLYELIYTVILYAILLIAIYNGVPSLVLLLFFTAVTVFYNIVWATLTIKMIEGQYRTIYLPAAVHLLILAICIFYLGNI